MNLDERKDYKFCSKIERWLSLGPGLYICFCILKELQQSYKIFHFTSLVDVFIINFRLKRLF